MGRDLHHSVPPETTGVVQVTASAFGVISAPTLVYVHPPIDTIQITEVTPVTSPPPGLPGQQVIPAGVRGVVHRDRQ